MCGSVQNFIDHGKVGTRLLFKRSFTIPCATNEKDRYEADVEFRICKNKSESWVKNIDLSDMTDSSYITLSFIGNIRHIENIREGVNVSEECSGGGPLCSHIILGLIDEVPNEDFSDLRKILELWERWHCNELNPGSDRQRAAIEKFEAEFGKNLKYDEVCEFLKLIDLYEDRGYKYGHAWLYEKVPNEVIKELASLFEGFEAKEDEDEAL